VQLLEHGVKGPTHPYACHLVFLVDVVDKFPAPHVTADNRVDEGDEFWEEQLVFGEFGFDVGDGEMFGFEKLLLYGLDQCAVLLQVLLEAGGEGLPVDAGFAGALGQRVVD
jgi:hypothetical protein